MKRVLFGLVAAIALSGLPVGAEWLNMKSLKVAVLDVVSRVQNEKVDTATLTEMLQVALVDRNEFQIVERSLLDKILKEQELQIAGLTNGDAAKIGALVGANKVMLVSIAKLADKYIFIVKGIDSKTGIVDLTDQVLSYTIGGFIDVLPILADRLVRKARGESVGAFQIPSNQIGPTAAPLAVAPTSPPNNNAVDGGIGGTYKVVGRNPNGSSYRGTCTVARQPDGTYLFNWIVAGATYVGTGTLDGGILSVDWGDSTPVTYNVKQNGAVLDGTWSGGTATETLTR